MATFCSALLGQPEIASMVFGYQYGLYEDVHDAFVACNKLVEYEEASRREFRYACDVSFGQAFAPAAEWPSDFRAFDAETYALCDDQRDDRLPLHLAIAHGCVCLVKRMLRCRPNLASHDAFFLAIKIDRLDIAELLLEQLATALQLDDGSDEQRTTYLFDWVPIMARKDTRALVLLQRFGLRCNEISDNNTWAILGTLETLTFALDAFPWLAYLYILDDIAAKGFLPLVQLLHERGRECTEHAMGDAAANGHLEVVRFLHFNRTESCMWAMDYAAANGHLEIVRFLHFNRTEGCTTDAMDYAAANGHLEVVRFLHLNRAEGCTGDAVGEAVKNGHLEVVQFLATNWNKVDARAALLCAITSGHLDIVRFVIEQGIADTTPDALDVAAKNGHLDIVKYLDSLGSLGCTAAAVNKAAAGGHLEVVQFLLTHRSEGCSRDNVVKKALRGGHLRTAEYLPSRWDAYSKPEMLRVLQRVVDNGGSWDEVSMSLACASNNLPLVQVLHEHANEYDGAFKAAIAHEAWDAAHFLLVKSTPHDAFRLFHVRGALTAMLKAGYYDDMALLVQREPKLREDTFALDVALQSRDMKAARYMLDAGIGNPRSCLLKLTGRRQHVTDSKLLLPYCMKATDHLDNVAFLVDLYEIPHRHRKTTLELITPELANQAKLAGNTIQLVPSVAGRAATVLEAGDALNWALAVAIGHRWATDATAATVVLQSKITLVHDRELRARLNHLLSGPRPFTTEELQKETALAQDAELNVQLTRLVVSKRKH